MLTTGHPRVDDSEKRESIAPQAACLQKERRREMFVMHAFPRKAKVLPSMLRARRICVEGYRVREELENRQSRRKTGRCLYADWGIRFQISASIRDNRKRGAETKP